MYRSIARGFEFSVADRVSCVPSEPTVGSEGADRLDALNANEPNRQLAC